MDSARLLECLSSDFARLRAVAAATDLTAKVPSCPEWTVADLVRHVGAVYLHKVECMRQQVMPEPWPPPHLAGEEPLALLDRAYTGLVEEFAGRSPHSSAFTWYAPDQTVGFWMRRMAHETVIHRVDAELGAGVPLAPISEDLARDGVDELLHAFVEYGSQIWHEDFVDVLESAYGQCVRIDTSGASWLLRLTPAAVVVSTATGVTDPDAVITSDPVSLLLRLWSRAAEVEVRQQGDSKVIADLFRVIVAATQ